MAPPTHTTRRDFLRGKAARDAAGKLLPFPPAARHDAQASNQADSLITVSRRAMACQFQIAVPATFRNAIHAASQALDTIEQLENQLTVYSESSEVSAINRLAGAGPVPVEPRLFELFELAERLSRETDGAFDIAAGALVKAWGFFRGPKRVPDPDELQVVLQRVGSHHLTLDRVRRTIQWAPTGLEINLGAIGKGYALDRAGEQLRHHHVPSALLHGGSSSVLALGSFGEPRDGVAAGWLVSVGDPHRPGESLVCLRLMDCALGTSGATIQYFAVGGRQFGHILDPRTGWPAAGQACVAVIAPSAALADALSTAFYILGPDAAAQYCERHPDVGAIVVPESPPGAARELIRLGRAEQVVEDAATVSS